MRTIKNIVVHCTATTQNAKVSSILKYWREQLGWKYPGYHYIIKADGEIVQLQDESIPSNGVAGENKHLVNICYIGGVDSNNHPLDNRTPQQRASMLYLLEQLRERYPNATIKGHRDFPNVAKDCPCFDAQTEYKNI